jgi:hypothetical protein
MPRPAVLFGADGTPQPPADVSAWLAERGLRLYKFPREEREWGILCEWREDDPRREMAKRGELAADSTFDLIGYLPMDCPLEQAPGYIARQLRQHPKEEIAKLADRLTQGNEKEVAAAQIEELMTDLTDNRFGAEDHKVKGRRTKHPKA